MPMVKQIEIKSRKSLVWIAGDVVRKARVTVEATREGWAYSYPEGRSHSPSLGCVHRWGVIPDAAIKGLAEIRDAAREDLADGSVCTPEICAECGSICVRDRKRVIVYFVRGVWDLSAPLAQEISADYTL